MCITYVNVNTPNDPLIYPIPHYGGNGLYIELSSYTQGIQLYSNADLTTHIANGVKYQQFRYMIIPVNVKATARSTVNWSDYVSAKTYLGLKN